jgi:alpha-beta hydrolase superfamily lysophospholipase
MRKFGKRILRLFIFLFLVVNGFLIMHAYKFTHFDPSLNAKHRTATPSEISSEEKINALLFGVSLPKPRLQNRPSYSIAQVKVASNATLDGWLHKTPNAKGIVVLCHGYGGEKSSINNVAYQFQRLGYDTYQFDFMGAGGSSSNKCTIGYKEAENIKDVVAYLQSKGYRNIYGYGVSMGAVALLRAAGPLKVPLKAMIIECPFGSMLGTVSARFDVVSVPSFPLANMLTFWGGTINGFNAFSHDATLYAKDVTIPTLLMSGNKDEYVTLKEINNIYANLNGKKKLYIVNGAKHENYNNRFQGVWLQQVRPFLQSIK